MVIDADRVKQNQRVGIVIDLNQLETLMREFIAEQHEHIGTMGTLTLGIFLGWLQKKRKAEGHGKT